MTRIVPAFGLLLLLVGPGRARAQAEPPPAEARDPLAYDFEGLLDLPEPMVFDLVRRLGCKPYEIEVNTLVLAPLKRRPTVGWSPEIEFAIAHGHAIEIEVDAANGRTDRFQLAYQGTFGHSRGYRFIHGFQLLGGYRFEGRALEGTALYMSAIRLTRRLTFWTLVGGRVEHASEVVPDQGPNRLFFVLNPSLFVRVHRRFNVGLETNWAVTAGESRLLLMPQVEWDITDDLQFQIGVGPRWMNARVEPVLAARLTWDRD